MSTSAWTSAAVRDAAEITAERLDELSLVLFGRSNAIRVISPFGYGVHPQGSGAQLDICEGDVAKTQNPRCGFGIIFRAPVIDQRGEGGHRGFSHHAELLDLTEQHANRMAHVAHLGLGHGNPFLFWSGRR